MLENEPRADACPRTTTSRPHVDFIGERVEIPNPWNYTHDEKRMHEGSANALAPYDHTCSEQQRLARHAVLAEGWVGFGRLDQLWNERQRLQRGYLVSPEEQPP